MHRMGQHLGVQVLIAPRSQAQVRRGDLAVRLPQITRRQPQHLLRQRRGDGRPTCKENRFAGLPQPDQDRRCSGQDKPPHHQPPTDGHHTLLPHADGRPCRDRAARTSAAAVAGRLSWPPDRRRLGAIALNIDRQPQRMAAIGALHRTRKVLLLRQGVHPPATEAIAPRDLRTVKQAAGRGQDAPRRVRDLQLIIAGRHKHAVRADPAKASVRDRGAHRDRRPAT
jgi:hypothetical protein